MSKAAPALPQPVNFRRDQAAASPLMVIATFVLVAAGLTALLFFAFVDTAPDTLAIEQGEAEGGPAFRVVSKHGDLAWERLTVRFIDPAGVDRASLFLAVPGGSVDTDDAITMRTLPPPGTYHLRIYRGEAELERLVYAA